MACLTGAAGMGPAVAKRIVRQLERTPGAVRRLPAVSVTVVDGRLANASGRRRLLTHESARKVRMIGTCPDKDWGSARPPPGRTGPGRRTRCKPGIADARAGINVR